MTVEELPWPNALVSAWHPVWEDDPHVRSIADAYEADKKQSPISLLSPYIVAYVWKRES